MRCELSFPVDAGVVRFHCVHQMFIPIASSGPLFNVLHENMVERSIDPLDCGRYAVVLYMFILYVRFVTYHAAYEIRALICDPSLRRGIWIDKFLYECFGYFG